MSGHANTLMHARPLMSGNRVSIGSLQGGHADLCASCRCRAEDNIARYIHPHIDTHPNSAFLVCQSSPRVCTETLSPVPNILEME